MLRFLSEKRTQLVIIAVLTFLAYSNIFRNEFVIDDRAFIVDWQVKNSLGNVVEFFKGAVPSGHEGVYRPLRSIIYALDWRLFGDKPFGYHLQSILIHLASTVLVYLIVETLIEANFKRMKANERMGHLLPFLAALLFGLHPIHTETITYIASSVESIGIVFFLLSFYLFLKFSQRQKRQEMLYIWSVGLAILAYLTTELTLALPLVIILYEICFKKITLRNFNKRLIFYSPYLVFAVIYILIRFLVIGVGARGPYLADSVYLTVLTMTKVFVKYLSLLILPINQANNHIISEGIEAFVYRDYRTGSIMAQSILDLEILAAILVILVLLAGAVGVIKKQPIFSFGIGWFFLTLLPVSEIVPQGSVLNEKFLYLPSFGLIFVLVWLIAKLDKLKIKNLSLIVLFTIALIFALLTFIRNKDWRDDITLWSRDVQRSPNDNAYAYFQLGNAYVSRGAVDLAVENFQRSFEINSGFVVALGGIGGAYNNVGKQDLAIDFYRKSLEVNPYFWEAHRDLANIYTARADFDLAGKEYQQILQLLPDFAPALENLKTLPILREATGAGNVADEGVWLRYHNLGGISLTIPSKWRLSSGWRSISVSDDRNELAIAIQIDQKLSKASFSDYLKEQTETYGQLINEGLALVPNFDQAYVRVWKKPINAEKDADLTDSAKSVPNQQNQLVLMEFFLFKGDKVVRVLVSPADSPQIPVFDIILGSVRI